MTNLKWAMVGTGFMAELILNDFALADDTKLYALVSREPSKAQARLAEFGISAKALGFEEALRDAEIDVIYVATPHSEHFAMAKAALEAGKHVLVEKAFTLNEAEAQALIALAKSKGLFLMEAMWTKFLPLHNAVKQMIENKEIGELVSIEAHFGFNPPYNNEHRLFKNELGGGTTLDQGVYTTAVNRWWAGSPIKTQTTIGRRFEDGADSHADTTFLFENGVIGHGVSSLISWQGFGARVIGTKHSVELVGSFWNSRELDLVIPDGQQPPIRKRISYETKGAGYAHMLQAVSRAILDGKLECEEHQLADTLESMRVLDEIRNQIS